MAALATIGPVSIAIDASHESFQFYSAGMNANNMSYKIDCDFKIFYRCLLRTGLFERGFGSWSPSCRVWYRQGW